LAAARQLAMRPTAARPADGGQRGGEAFEWGRHLAQPQRSALPLLDAAAPDATGAVGGGVAAGTSRCRLRAVAGGGAFGGPLFYGPAPGAPCGRSGPRLVAARHRPHWKLRLLQPFGPGAGGVDAGGL